MNVYIRLTMPIRMLNMQCLRVSADVVAVVAFVHFKIMGSFK